MFIVLHFSPRYDVFQPFYMILGALIVIRRPFHFSLSWNKRRSQVIVDLHERKVWGDVSCNTNLIIKHFYFFWHIWWNVSLIYKEAVEVCYKSNVWVRWGCKQDFLKRYLNLACIFISRSKSLNLVESYSFYNRGRQEKAFYKISSGYSMFILLQRIVPLD